MKAKKIVTRIYYKHYSQTFTPSASFQTFTVPSNISGDLNVDCVASKGANKASSGGNGGRVQCYIPATPSSTLYIYVGAIPSSNSTAEYNASDIRTNNDGVTNNTSLSSRIVVAGGGGSGCNNSNYAGGVGGGLTGGNGGAFTNSYATGGTQTAGGSKPSKYNGNNGTFGLGGNAYAANGGAGGAGWYGGGGADGSNNTRMGGGGGGSSYTDSSCREVVHIQGYNDGSGYITISWDGVSTSSDYDYYKETCQVKVFNKNNTYYAMQDYKKGQHYGN